MSSVRRLSAVDVNPLDGSMCVRGLATGGTLILLRSVQFW